MTNENKQEEPQVQGNQDKPELDTGLDAVTAEAPVQAPATAGGDGKKAPVDITKLKVEKSCSRGLSGWLAANGKTKPTFEDLKTAVVHGSVTASYTCEAFSTHKLQTVTKADISQ